MDAVAYILTHYPRVSQTFLAKEIAALRTEGTTVLPIAMNAPSGVDAEHPEVATTFYLKPQGAVGALRAARRALAASPRSFLSTLRMAVRSAGTDVRDLGKRTGHFAEAIMTWDECERRGISHLHAHFGQTPSTIAMLAAHFGRGAGKGPRTWTFTVHCASEVYDARWSLPAEKVEEADATVCVCDHTRSQLMWATDPALWDRLRVVRCGIDLDALTLRAPRPVADPPTILIVGRLDPAKGHLVLFDAIAELRNRGVIVQVTAVGGGSSEQLLRDRCVELGVDDLVVFAGEQPPATVRELLESADGFCLPSFDEGLPVSIMEAMAVGVPVVTTYVAGVPELAVHDHTALVAPAGNATALARELERVVTDEALRARLIANAREAVVHQHDERITMPELVKVLQEAAS